MAEFTIQGAYDTLFAGDDFVATAKLTATRNQLDNTFTVAVTGMKAWSKYTLNRALSVSCWLAKDSSGTEKVPGSCTIPASGSNSYKGDLPVGGGYTSISGCSKTFDGNSSTGECPTVYLYFSVSTGNVKWLSKSTETNIVYASATSTHSGNISSSAQSAAGGANDRVAPVIDSASVAPVASNSASYSIKVNTGSSGGTYSIVVTNTTNNSTASKNSCADDSTASGSISARAQNNTISIVATKDRNGLTDSWSDTADCSLPNCTLSVVPTGLTTATASIKCTNFKTYARINSNSYGTTQTNANTNRTINITGLSNTVHTITANTKRVDCAIESSTVSTTLDMKRPSVTNVTVTPLLRNKGRVTFQSDFSGTAEWTNSDRSISQTFTISAANTSYTWDVSLTDNTSDTYLLRVRRSGTHSVLYTDVSRTVSSTLSTATLSSVSTAGNALTAQVTVVGSLKNNNITAKLVNAQQNYSTNSVSGILVNGKYVFDFTGLPINMPLALEVTMQNNSSGLYNTQTLNSEQLKCLGILYVYNGQSWQLGVTHVYDGTKFIAGAPYVATDNSQGSTEWVYGKVVE